MEEVVDSTTESGGGFEPVTTCQFTVFLENRVGRFSLLIRALEEGTRVVGLAIEESADTALARVICSSADAARELLRNNGFSFGETEVLVVGLPRHSSTPVLAIASVLLSVEINIHNAYPLLICPYGPALVVYCDDHILAAQLLLRKGFRIIAESDFNNPPMDLGQAGNN